MIFNTNDRIIEDEDGHNFDPFKLCFEFLGEVSLDFLYSIKVNNSKVFAINFVEFLSVKKLMEKIDEEDCKKHCDHFVNFKNPSSNIDVNFYLTYYDEFLCEVYFDQFCIVLYPLYIMELSKRDELKMNKISY